MSCNFNFYVLILNFRMYNAGIDVNLAAIYPKIEFPVSRGTASLSPLVHWEHSEKWRIGIEDKMNYLVSVKDVHIMLNSEEFRYCSGHELDDDCIFPLSACLVRFSYQFIEF